MRPALSYLPRRTPLHDAGAAAASVYLGSFAVCAFVYSNPIVLAGAGAGVVVAGLASGAGRALRAACAGARPWGYSSSRSTAWSPSEATRSSSTGSGCRSSAPRT